MNTDLEEAPTADTLIPEVLTDEQVHAIEHPEALLQQLELCKTRFTTLKPVDDLTVKQCAALIETCAFASRYAEGRRTAITEPLNKQVKDANDIWQPIVKGFKEIAQSRGADVARFIDDRRRAAEREQQRLIDEAKAKQDELDRKAKQEREEAERIRLQADQAKTVEEAEVLHQQADKLEKKADLHEVKAEQVVTQVVQTQARSVDTGSATFSARAPKKTWILAAWDKAKPLRCTDPALSKLFGDFSTLPEGVRFLLQHSDLSPVHLNKSFGVIDFPAPFATIDEFKGSSVKGK